ncbi:MAG: dihydroneopterin aldolase [Actinomycetota bacterium]|nr:dihydroneopterin aldolase [Actinomycetota bacterium]MDA8174867.1 dihydroneopterin aldolase [Nitrospiraceae bacterium]
MDRILIKDLLVRAIIGVFEEERREKQDVLINITMFADLEKAGTSDSISDTVDYRKIKKEVLRFAENSSFRLAEALAEAVAKICLSEQHVKAVRVTVEKPGALRFARSAGVEIFRRK